MYLCGDWVRFPSPAVYMEKAFVTGMAAAGRVLEREGLQAPAIQPFPPPSRLQENCQWVINCLARLPPPQPGRSVQEP